MSSTGKYANMKARASTLPEDESRLKQLEQRIRSENMPLTEAEEATARSNWNRLRATAPFMAELVQEMSRKGMVNGRRRLAEMTITTIDGNAEQS